MSAAIQLISFILQPKKLEVKKVGRMSTKVQKNTKKNTTVVRML